MPGKGRWGSEKMGVTAPVALKQWVGRSAKQETPVSWGPEAEPSHQGSRKGGPRVMDVLLDISSWLQLEATEAYIASQQETERVYHTGGAT